MCVRSRLSDQKQDLTDDVDEVRLQFPNKLSLTRSIVEVLQKEDEEGVEKVVDAANDDVDEERRVHHHASPPIPDIAALVMHHLLHEEVSDVVGCRFRSLLSLAGTRDRLVARNRAGKKGGDV